MPRCTKLDADNTLREAKANQFLFCKGGKGILSPVTIPRHLQQGQQDLVIQ